MTFHHTSYPSTQNISNENQFQKYFFIPADTGIVRPTNKHIY